MKKKLVTICIVVAFICLITYLLIPKIIDNIQHPHDLQGNYYNIDDLRDDIDKNRKPTYYKDCIYLFSKDFGDVTIDFTIKPKQISIIKISHIKDINGITKYGYLTGTAGELDYIIAESKDAYDWNKFASVLMPNTTTIQWCIVNESSGLYDEKYESFKFEYNGETYYILYEVMSNK
ncbi:MAG: hypothetical protein IKP68_05250 [Clostridia bacterium]|nr:hypothetical protein [Clostridia bacterium]